MKNKITALLMLLDLSYNHQMLTMEERIEGDGGATEFKPKSDELSSEKQAKQRAAQEHMQVRQRTAGNYLSRKKDIQNPYRTQPLTDAEYNTIRIHQHLTERINNPTATKAFTPDEITNAQKQLAQDNAQLEQLKKTYESYANFLRSAQENRYVAGPQPYIRSLSSMNNSAKLFEAQMINYFQELGNRNAIEIAKAQFIRPLTMEQEQKLAAQKQMLANQFLEDLQARVEAEDTAIKKDSAATNAPTHSDSWLESLINFFKKLWR